MSYTITRLASSSRRNTINSLSASTISMKSGWVLSKLTLSRASLCLVRGLDVGNRIHSYLHLIL
ncbi:hypothetical protein O6H91_22G049700 [Diphasiastrum complanatum]|uniref:Uncharacterized protein n=1 Tax=Diphasiastrum complanatum TaxID=34168 RepID=A0ACC2AFA6_DIPCM|nr:hypothetical protein O6H91_22G049700 [Diphasiastrum complanatum]